MSGGFFRGTTADQDTRFSNKQAKLLKTHKFPPELDQSVDIAKVKMDVIKPWIATRVTELLGFEDEVLINFIYGLLESKNLDGKQIQIQLTGFMEKNTSKFMKELWGLLISAQNNASGVPQQFLDAKQLEIQKKKEESERIMEEIQKKREKEKAEEELERKNKRADETLIPEEEISAKDPTKHNNKSPSRNRKSPLASRSRSNSPSRDDGDKWRRRVIRPHRRRRSPSLYRRSGRRYRSPDFAPRRSSPSRRRSPPHSSRRRSPPPPPPQRKRSPSPYERPSQEEYRRKDNRRPPAQHFTDADVAEKPRQHTRDRTVISSKIRRLSPDGSPAGSESPDFVLRKSPPQRRSVSPYGSRSMRDRKVISTKNRHSPSPPRNESARYKRRHDSPEMSPDEELAPRARKSEIVRRAVHEPSESPDERDNNYGPKRKQKESFPPDDYNNYNNDDYVTKRKSKEYVKSKRYEVEEEEEYGPGSFKKQQKKKMGEFSSESEYETEKRHKGKRKQKKYEKHSDESSEESELSDEEFRRKRREKERHLKNEEKREKYEEKRKRKSEVRNEDFGDESEEEERQKRLEVELREKALQSLRAKKGSSNC